MPERTAISSSPSTSPPSSRSTLFKERVDAISRQIRDSRRRPGVDRLYPPGLLEWEFERRYAEEGIPLNDVTIAGIRDAARRLGIEVTLP